ncbi:hypothetical protein BDR05DRAFT_955144 [Suillus weaverae]|nr:hypothetical protein BDR05DRAFT_955144 [Suillus weaverae]
MVHKKHSPKGRSRSGNDTFKVARDNHINIVPVTFILYTLPIALTTAANAYPSS